MEGHPSKTTDSVARAAFQRAMYFVKTLDAAGCSAEFLPDGAQATLFECRIPKDGLVRLDFLERPGEPRLITLATAGILATLSADKVCYYEGRADDIEALATRLLVHACDIELLPR